LMFIGLVSRSSATAFEDGVDTVCRTSRRRRGHRQQKSYGHDDYSRDFHAHVVGHLTYRRSAASARPSAATEGAR